MGFWIDCSISKKEWHSLSNVWITEYRCGCKACRQCWFRPDIEACIAGGPYAGYEEFLLGSPQDGAKTTSDVVA